MIRHVLITGVSSGIGYDAAREMLAHGWHVFGSVRNRADGERVVRELGPGLTPLLFDVTDPGAIADAVLQVAAALDGAGLAGLVNNAGIAPTGPLMHMPIAEFRKVMDINVTGLLQVTQAFLPLLGAGQRHRCGPGRVVNLSSVSGGVTMPLVAAYSASKYAVEALSDGMRRELAMYGIHVAAIEPGMTRTPIWDKAGASHAASPYAGTDYAQAMDVMADMARIDGANGKPVQTVSRAIFHALTARRPKARYPLDAMWHARHLLPDRLLDRVLQAKLKLGRRP